MFVDEDPTDEEDNIKFKRITKYPRVPNSFDINRIKRLYKLHHVAMPGTWQIDIMFSGQERNAYLVAINVNTRYLYIQRTNTYLYDTVTNKKILKDNGKPKIEKKSEYAVAKAMGRLFCLKWDPCTIVSDHEKAFNSKNIINMIYKPRRIKHRNVYLITDEEGKRHSNHTSLAMVDRVIRTCKEWVFNRGWRKGYLPAREVMEFVKEYNNRPHSTLCKILDSKDATPSLVNNNIYLEMKVIYYILNKNREKKKFNTYDFKIPNGTIVKMYRPPTEKNKDKTKPDPYRVISSNETNLYVVQNLNTEEYEYVPRIWLDYLNKH